MVALAPGCHRDGCVGGDDGTCAPPTACAALHYPTCASEPRLNATTLGEAGPLLGPKARGAAGDILLENDLVRIVVDAPSHPAGLAPTGGSIIDFALAPDWGDQINQIYQAAGLLPRDAVHYEHVEQLQGESYVAVVFRGHLEADSRVTVVTRYELRACEPGVRVSTDLYNGGSDPNTLFLADGFFWGDNGAAPFVPGIGLGFRAPPLRIREVDKSWREWPFVAARTQAVPNVSYAVVPCNDSRAAGFNDPTLTASGAPLATTLPGDGIHYERFILAAQGPGMTPGPGLAPAVDEALKVRAMVHGEPPPVTVSGRVVSGGVPVVAEAGRAASLLFYEPAFGPDPDDPARRTPWSEAVPGSDGRFSVMLPRDRSYRVQPWAFGLPAAAATSFAVARDDVDLGDITVPASARLRATVVTTPGQAGPDEKTFAELVLVPVTPPSGDAPPPSLYGLFPGCDPMLGPPHGGSPACNRAVTNGGGFDLRIPPGQYYVYATRGPFATLDRAEITVAAGGTASLSMVVQSLPLLPPGALSGDFHVHGAASFDSSIPDQTRVISFLAAGVDVVVATDHDVVTTYKDTLEMLGLATTGRITVISGTEQTPNIPWFAVPGNDLPTTVGHFNFWPLDPDRSKPRNGAPWDELREPGQMMDEMDALFAGVGVRQLNHPFSETKLGREQGFLRAIKYDPRTPIASGASFAADVLLREPGGAGHHQNLDWDVQEVMTGASIPNWLRYRALWFSLLSQGLFRAGTANSDTHSLGLERIGYPRNIVFDVQSDPLDVERFDEAVRSGHMVGTNGPVLDVSIIDGAASYRPGRDPITVSESAQLSITVMAAPWIPIEEIRIIVNGTVKMTSPGAMVADHFGTQVVKIGAFKFPLRPLLTSMKDGDSKVGDSWLIVEAGHKLPPLVDVDGDGLPDVADTDLPRRVETDATFDYQAIVPGSFPVAFTNPFIIDVDGGGWQAPGLP